MDPDLILTLPLDSTNQLPQVFYVVTSAKLRNESIVQQFALLGQCCFLNSYNTEVMYSGKYLSFPLFRVFTEHRSRGSARVWGSYNNHPPSLLLHIHPSSGS